MMMSAPEYIKNTQGKLEENKYYDFKILKTTTAPDDISYFIIEDPFDQKHMMEAECYKLYDFKKGASGNFCPFVMPVFLIYEAHKDRG